MRRREAASLLALAVLGVSHAGMAAGEQGAAAPAPEPATAAGVGIAEIVRRAEEFSPALKAARQAERQADESIRIQRAAYFPTLDLLALDSAGFPASSTAPAGFDGVMVSPFRDGWAAGAYTTLSLFDLTREYGVRAAQTGLQAAREASALTQLRLDLEAANLFMDAVRNRSEREVWHGIEGEVEQLYELIRKYVRNGQYSDVTQWLLKVQSEDAIRRQGVFEQGFETSVRRLEILTGAQPGSLALAGPEALPPALERLRGRVPPESPWIGSPRTQALTLHAEADAEAARGWPRLLATASAGALDGARLVPLQNYSAWIGVTFPLFEGFRLQARARYASIGAERQDDLTRQAALDLTDSLSRYEEQAAARRIDVERFSRERDFARRALDLAVRRYRSFVGDLADVRDSLASYEASAGGLVVAQAELLRAEIAGEIARGAAF